MSDKCADYKLPEMPKITCGNSYRNDNYSISGNRMFINGQYFGVIAQSIPDIITSTIHIAVFTEPNEFSPNGTIRNFSYSVKR